MVPSLDQTASDPLPSMLRECRTTNGSHRAAHLSIISCKAEIMMWQRAGACVYECSRCFITEGQRQVVSGSISLSGTHLRASVEVSEYRQVSNAQGLCFGLGPAVLQDLNSSRSVDSCHRGFLFGTQATVISAYQYPRLGSSR